MKHENEQITIGSKKCPIVISLKEFKGNPLIDIRKFYLNKSDQELKPTKKGISLQKNNYALLIDTLVSSSEQINDWFETNDHTTLQKTESMLKSRVIALEEKRRDAQDFNVNKTKWKAPNFFEIESLGGKDNVIFNSQHIFVQELSELDLTSEKDAFAMISKILVAYSKAKNILDGGEEYTAGELFKYLETEWGQILSNYVSPAKK